MLRRVIVIAGLAATAACADPVFSPIQVDGAAITHAASINSAGDVAGDYFTENFDLHSFVRHAGGAIETFDLKNFPSEARVIDDKGDVLGISYRRVLDRTYLRRANGTIKEIKVPGADRAGAYTMNSQGAMVGATLDERGYPITYFTHAPGGDYVFFDMLGGLIPLAMNDGGSIAGHYICGRHRTKYCFFIRKPNGNIKTFGTEGRRESGWVTGFNNQGIVVGNIDVSAGTLRPQAFERWPDGKLEMVEIVADHETQIFGINAAGTIAGMACDSSTCHGFTRNAGGEVALIDYPGATFTSLSGINDDGMVIGSASVDFHWVEFIRTP